MKPKILANNAADFLNVTVQAIHKQLKNKNMSFDKTKNRVFFGHETSKLLFGLKIRPTVISSQIVKGGVLSQTGAISIS